MVNLAIYTTGAPKNVRDEVLARATGKPCEEIHPPVTVLDWLRDTDEWGRLELRRAFPDVEKGSELRRIFAKELEYLVQRYGWRDTVFTEAMIDSLGAKLKPPLIQSLKDQPYPWATVAVLWLAKWDTDAELEIAKMVGQLDDHFFVSECSGVYTVFARAEMEPGARWNNLEYIVMDTFTRWVCTEERMIGERLDEMEHNIVRVERICQRFFEITGIRPTIGHRASYRRFFVDFCLIEAKHGMESGTREKGKKSKFPELLRCAPLDVAFFLLRTTGTCPRIWTDFATDLARGVSWHGLEAADGTLAEVGDALLAVHNTRVRRGDDGTKQAIDEIVSELGEDERNALEYICVLLGRTKGDLHELVEALGPAKE
jgi:hypothetical protein